MVVAQVSRAGTDEQPHYVVRSQDRQDRDQTFPDQDAAKRYVEGRLRG